LFQLLCQHESDLLSYLYENAAKNSKAGRTTLSDTILANEILETALQSCGGKTVYLVLDGLDECEREHRKDITKTFQNIIDSIPSSQFGKIRCVFVCQNDGPARRDLAMVPCIQIGMENKRDIHDYALYWSAKIQYKFELDAVETERIANLVTERSDGE
jgi:hypothetical protein